MKIVPDTSIIIDGKITHLLSKNKNKIKLGKAPAEIIIPEFVIQELENQANRGRETGIAGLEEIKELRKIAETKYKGKIKVVYKGRLPTQEEIGLAGSGRIDALIRNIAEKEKATLFTSDKVQYMVAEAKGIKCEYFPPEKEVEFSLKDYFKKDVLSVHLKTGVVPLAKRGKPGELKLVKLGDKELTEEEIKVIAKETIETAKTSENGLVEIVRKGAIVLQIGDLRIVITRPPFSETTEITAVKPIVNMSLEDYKISKKLKNRFKEKAEGILIAGAPGHGKSTFAQALAEFYMKQGNIVKTIEQPRDLQLPKEITHYSPLEGKIEDTGDILLLVRPDYTVFDEVRKTKDFLVFADMRLAGVGMIGVVHASRALDAIQRLIGRIELGVIPQVVDTVVFIRNASIERVYRLELTVKVPNGMTEEDLARPVIEVKDFETEKAEYEIYTYGEETVVIPIKEDSKNGAKSKKEELALEQIKHRLGKYIHDPEVEFISNNRVRVMVDENQIAKIIGREGRRINKIEKELGLKISVEPNTTTMKKRASFVIEELGNTIAIVLDSKHSGKVADIYEGNEFLFSATVGKKGVIRVTKDFELSKRILGAYYSNKLRAYI